VARARGREARERAHDVNRRIIEDRVGEPPVFNRASQNVVVAAMLLRNMLKPSTPEAHRARDEIRGLLEATALQQAKSSALRRCGAASGQPVEPSRQEKEASVHPEPAPQGNKAAPVYERIIDNREPRDVRNDINERRRLKAMTVHPEATTCTGEGDMTTQRIIAHLSSRRALES
jgi:hypothetical protein